jgi:hypothetical protein
MMNIDVIDSTAFRLSRINPNTGVVTFISPNNIGVGGNLTAAAFIDPNSMTYFFSNGNQIVGVSLITGLITSSTTKTFPSGGIAFDMMRSTQNCFGASKIRLNTTTGGNDMANVNVEGLLFPNPAHNTIELNLNTAFSTIEIFDFRGSLMFKTKEKTIDISSLPSGLYMARVFSENAELFTGKFIKN